MACENQPYLAAQPESAVVAAFARSEYAGWASLLVGENHFLYDMSAAHGN